MNTSVLKRLLLGLLFTLALTAGAYTPPSDPDELMKLSDEMREYFGKFVHSHDTPLEQANELIDAILDADKFHFTYQWDGLYDVREVFKTHSGNCISFSLFVNAIFSEFGLKPTLNEVLLYRTRWSSMGQFVVEVGHINVSIRDYDKVYSVDFSRIFGQELSIDTCSPISDRAAISMFYSNYGVQAYTRQQADALFWLKKAVEVDGNYLSHSNLATAYIHEKAFDLAKKHLDKAARHRKDARVFALLSSIERGQGNEKAADAAWAKAKKYMESNPFYHYNLALQAFAKGDYARAQKALNKALNLKEEIIFLRLQVSIYQNLLKNTSSLERRIAGLSQQPPTP